MNRVLRPARLGRTHLRKHVFTFAAMAGIFLSACETTEDSEDPDDRSARLEAYVDDSITQANRRISLYCQCWMDLGFDGQGDCENANEFVLPAQIRCYKDAYSQNAEVSLQYFECTDQLTAELTSCVDQRLECDDPNSIALCNSDFDIGLRQCIQLPNAIVRYLEQCRPNDPEEDAADDDTTSD